MVSSERGGEEEREGERKRERGGEGERGLYRQMGKREREKREGDKTTYISTWKHLYHHQLESRGHHHVSLPPMHAL